MHKKWQNFSHNFCIINDLKKIAYILQKKKLK